MADRDRPRGRGRARPPDRSRSRSGDRDRGFQRDERRDSYRRDDDRYRGGEEDRGRSGGYGDRDRSTSGYDRDRGSGGGGGGGYGGDRDRSSFGGDRSSFGGDRDRERGSYGGGGGGGNYGRDQRGGYGDRGGDRGYGGGGDRDRGGESGGYGGGGDRGGYSGRGGFGRGGGGGRGGFGGDRGGRGGYSGGGGGGGGFQEGPIPEKVEIFSNYFELLNKPNWHMYQYHVDFEPQIQSKRLKIALVKSQTQIFPKHTAFDGSTLFTTVKLVDDETIVNAVSKRDNNPIKIIIKKTADIYPTSDNFEINRYISMEEEEKLQKRPPHIEGEFKPRIKDKRNDFIRLLNLIFKRCLTLCGLTEFGRQRAYFDFKRTTILDKYHLTIANGYKASIEIYKNRLLLCSEIAHRLINSQSVLDFINDTYHRLNRDYERLKEACVNEIVGQTVMTNYNNRSYKVDDIAWNLNPTLVFETKKGSISLIEYYKNHYEIKIVDEKQPLLVSLPKEKDKRGGRSDPIYLLPELCVITGGSLMRPNDFTFKRDLDAVTKLNCQARYDKLVRLINTIKEMPEAKSELDKWEMNFSDDVVKFESKVSAQNTILFANTKETAKSNGWNNALRNARHISSVPLKKWLIVFMPRDQETARTVNHEIIDISRPMGFDVGEAKFIRLQEARGSAAGLFAQAIKHELEASKYQMVLCIVPSNAKDTYDAIKKICCLDYGIPSQVLTTNTLKKNLKSVLTKVAIQISCKLGGEIWGLNIPLKSIMVVGIDVYTDSSERTKRTVTAFVASMNANVPIPEIQAVTGCTRWYSRCMMESKEQKYSDWVELMMMDALYKYREKNGSLPERIFIYRDGVSDSQFDMIREIEIQPMKGAFYKVDPNYNPKLTVIIVKKRGNARFFMRGGRDLTNPYVGTIIDDKVVKEPGKDFYLISQHTNQGTVNPTHYHVIDGHENLPYDRLQTLTYKFTHLYYNWPGHIRVPAPCHYAHKLAFLVANSLHKPHDRGLDELLYYL